MSTSYQTVKKLEGETREFHNANKSSQIQVGAALFCLHYIEFVTKGVKSIDLSCKRTLARTKPELLRL